MGFLFCCSRKGAGHGRSFIEVETGITARTGIKKHMVVLVCQRESASADQAGRKGDGMERVFNHGVH